MKFMEPLEGATLLDQEDDDPLAGAVPVPQQAKASPDPLAGAKPVKPIKKQKPNFGSDYPKQESDVPVDLQGPPMTARSVLKDFAINTLKGAGGVSNQLLRGLSGAVQTVGEVAKPLGVIPGPGGSMLNASALAESGKTLRKYFDPKHYEGGNIVGKVIGNAAMMGAAPLRALDPVAGAGDKAASIIESGGSTGKAVGFGLGQGAFDYLMNKVTLGSGASKAEVQSALDGMKPALKTKIFNLLKSGGETAVITAANLVEQNLTDKYSGIDSERKLFAGADDALAMALGTKIVGRLTRAKELKEGAINKLTPKTKGGIQGETFTDTRGYLDKPMRVAQSHPLNVGYLVQPGLDWKNTKDAWENHHTKAREDSAALTKENMPLVRREIEARALDGRTLGELDPRTTKLVDDLQKSYADQADTVIERFTKLGESGDESAAKIADFFRKAREENPSYFPKYRDGKYAADIFDKKGQLMAVVAGNSENDVRQNAASFIKSNPNGEFEQGDLYTFNRGKGQGLSKASSEAITEAAQKIGVPEEYILQLPGLVEDLTRRRAAGGMAARMLESQNVPGFDADPLKAHAQYTTSMGKMIADVEHRPEFERRIGELAMKGDGDRVSPNQQAIDYARDYFEGVRSPKISKAAKTANKLTSAFTFLGDAAQIPVQVAQRFTHDMPTLLGAYGAKTGLLAWRQGAAVSARVQIQGGELVGNKNPFSVLDETTITNAPRGWARKQWADFVRDEFSRVYETGELMDVKRGMYDEAPKTYETGGRGTVKKAGDKLMDLGFAGLSKMEFGNRVQSLYANLYAIADKGFRVNEGAKHIDQVWRPDGKDYVKIGEKSSGGVEMTPQAAVKLALRMTDLTQNAAGTHNMSPLERAGGGMAGATVAKYAYFAPQMIQQLSTAAKDSYASGVKNGESPIKAGAKSAARVLAPVLVTELALAGKEGIPAINDISAMVKIIYNDILIPSGVVESFGGDPKEGIRSIDLFLEDELRALGVENDDVITAVRRGIPAAFGFDVGGRVGLGTLFGIREDKGLIGSLEGRVIGPASSVVDKLQRSGKAFAKGEVEEAGLAASPRGVESMIRAIADKRAAKDNKEPMTPGQRVKTFFGSRPKEDTDAFYQERIARERKKLEKMRQ